MSASLLRRVAVVGWVCLVGCGGKPEVIQDAPPGGGGNPSAPTTPVGATVLFRDSGLNATGGREDACDACASTSVCGDGKITPPESCDDGNSIPGDGCSGVCQIEPGYRCPTVGQSCVYSVATECGNGKIEGNETCDDGNAQNGDGCSSTCDVESGYACAVPGEPCVKQAIGVCGDGIVEFGEQCDDGSRSDAGGGSGDGCDARCQIEPGYTCPLPGTPCVRLEYCGDGIVEPNLHEQCDDGNTVPGDGCSGICTTEPGYSCSVPDRPCVNMWVCGNGKVDPGETCDDGNTSGSPVDGCTANCTVVPGWTCPKAPDGTGGACRPSASACGDAILEPGEECDDGNTSGSPVDGCSATCTVDPGWTCPVVGSACVKSAYCGNGVVDLALGEQCDDGGTKGGDGCSPICLIEAGYACPVPGAPCVSTVRCGDGKIGGAEQCDDGNQTSGDGCSSTCVLEAGWLCTVPAARCVAKACGDGILAGTEQCDDGGNAPGDGCSATCTLEPGFACSGARGATTVCHRTVCGDGKKEGFEQCDDGNRIPYDGCSPTCTLEPKCAGGTCTAVCGDGLKFPEEQCDDGNTTSGDGCSSTCTLEPGYACQVVTLSPPGQLQIPILYRDFLYAGTTVPGPGHPDFEAFYGNGATGIVAGTLGPDGKPVYASSQGLVTSPASFFTWYHEQQLGGAANPYEKLVYLDLHGNPTVLTLGQQSAGAYSFASAFFYPIDGLGWNAGNDPQVSVADDGLEHNFSFTSELRYQFTYQGGEVLDFTGDDDVWVFINGKLAVDLGGLHTAENGSITLNAATAGGLGLVKGGMYEIALFQAERHTTQSNYKLTLDGFVHAITECHSVCGDGIVTPDEVCDDGKNDGSYGGCMPGCQARGPFCGDKTVQSPPEACDDGTNLGSYGVSRVCAPGCRFAPYCGDGVVSNGEACDEGATNGAGYGHCTAACTLGPRCGDSIVNGKETCDDGISNGSTGSPCAANCTRKCGNGVLDTGEECDAGTAANVGGYGACNPDCTLGPRCGDGIKNGPETCDDGKNDGSYGTCNPNCTIAAYCGDGKVQNPPETCDLGSANSVTAYGKNACTNRCTIAPYCGDKAVDPAAGETCDDGVNSGKPGSCTTDCSGFVPLTSCGDGKIEPPEACDSGAANGTLSSACDAHCRFKCGNGVKDPGEECDDGVNDGSYGTCAPNCVYAGYCGDGVVNGPEQCDAGARNVSAAAAYGEGLCVKDSCRIAPYCGDGRIQSEFGETCDGGPNCTASCHEYVPH